jgi:hypothetical protein
MLQRGKTAAESEKSQKSSIAKKRSFFGQKSKKASF